MKKKRLCTLIKKYRADWSSQNPHCFTTMWKTYDLRRQTRVHRRARGTQQNLPNKSKHISRQTSTYLGKNFWRNQILSYQTASQLTNWIPMSMGAAWVLPIQQAGHELPYPEMDNISCLSLHFSSSFYFEICNLLSLNALNSKWGCQTIVHTISSK